jgi:hypothetical protein
VTPDLFVPSLVAELRLGEGPFPANPSVPPAKIVSCLLETLRLEDKALLKVLADAGGAMRQDALMQRLPMLRGRSSASLRSLKAHVNAACKQLDRAALLADGRGAGASRQHEINPLLGPLRAVVIDVARSFDIDWKLLEPLEQRRLR